MTAGNPSRIGKVERASLREVWKKEAKDFTPWLEENPDVLEEVIGIKLSSMESEKKTGDFRVDLVAQDGKDRVVVIEN